ncbi:MAG: 13E12 repeat family protein, partial [Gemmatimonadetes bacterium]|nr:13E12 repeat family protein [Gemmatimonadota bacterium]
MVRFAASPRTISAHCVRENAPPAYGCADPFEDADALEELGEEIATLAAHIHAATHRLLVLVADFDRRRGWELGGHPSCAHWLAERTGVDLHTAREKVRAARALAELPETSAAMARGELSFSAVRALTRVAEPETEGDLVELAQGCTTAQLERMLRTLRKGSHEDEAERERERHLSRTFSVFPDDDGMYVVKGRLMPEVAAVLMRAVDAAGDALYREHRAASPCARPSDDDTVRAAAQRRADAIGLLAERTLAAGFGGSAEGRGERRSGVPEEGAQAGRVPAGTSPVPVSGSRAERYQVVLHVDAATLEGDGGVTGRDRGVEPRDREPGRSHLDDGTRVPAGTSRRLSCDVAVVRV